MYGNLKAFRESIGMTQKEFATSLSIGLTTYNGYETGARDPKSDFWVSVAQKYGITIDYLMGHSNDPHKTSENDISSKLMPSEQAHIKKYRLLDPYGKEAVDGVLDVESRRCEAEKQARAAAVREEREKIEAGDMLELETVCFSIPWFSHPMSAGTGEIAESECPDDLRLIKAPPKGTSYIAPVKGDSMEPTFYDGDKLFIHACVDLMPGQIGVFFMDGKQWVKELGDGVLISHNPNYDPIPMCEDIACQGIVLGVCDDSYFE